MTKEDIQYYFIKKKIIFFINGISRTLFWGQTDNLLYKRDLTFTLLSLEVDNVY